MKLLKNTIALSLAAATLLVGAGVYAQQNNDATNVGATASAPNRSAEQGKRMQQRQQAMQAGMEKHHTRLHEQLKLTPQQEGAWTTFMEATKPRQAPMTDSAKAERQAMGAMSAPERMEKILGHAKQRLAHMQQHLDALKTFYAVLTPEQQKIFDANHQRMHQRMQHRMKMRMHDGMQHRMQGRMHDAQHMPNHAEPSSAKTSK